MPVADELPCLVAGPGQAGPLADAGEQLRIARLVAAELSRPDRPVEASVLDLVRAELVRAERSYLAHLAALGL